MDGIDTEQMTATSETPDLVVSWAGEEWPHMGRHQLSPTLPCQTDEEK